MLSAKEKEGNVRTKIKIAIPVLAVLAVFSAIAATAAGPVNIPFFQTVKIVLKNWGILSNTSFPEGWESIVYFVRLPRVATAALVGAGLAAAGTVMQGVFRNPMADPGILGVSSGAGLGAVTAIALGLAAWSFYFMPAFASVGSLAAALIIFTLSVRSGKITTTNLILSGIAVSYFFVAVTTVILTFIHGDQVKQFLFWTTGSLNGRRWEDAGIAFVPITAGIAVLLFFTRDLNVLLLGEEEAQAVGMNTSAVRKILLIIASVTTATAVCVSGTISFVGLIVPHIVRLLLGPDHRVLLPASTLSGAVFLMICDLIGRTVLMPGEIGVGIVTSLIGAPYFLFLLIKTKRGGAFF
jgi:iron complex transport system permease protein